MNKEELKELSRDALLTILSTTEYQTARWCLAMDWCQAHMVAPAGESEIFKVVGSGEYLDPFTKIIYIVSCHTEMRVQAVQVKETEKQYILSEGTVYRKILKKSERNKIFDTIVYNSYFMYSDDIFDILYMIECIKNRIIEQHQKLIKTSEDIIKDVKSNDVKYIDKNKFN